MYVHIHVFSQKIPTLYNQAGSSGEKKQRMYRLYILNNFNNCLLKRTVFKGTGIHAE